MNYKMDWHFHDDGGSLSYQVYEGEKLVKWARMLGRWHPTYEYRYHSHYPFNRRKIVHRQPSWRMYQPEGPLYSPEIEAMRVSRLV